MTARFGKHPRKDDYRTLRLKDYLSDVIAPPAAWDNLATIKQHLGATDGLFPMDGNDALGDCTIAALAHAVTVYQGLLGKKHVMTKATVEKLYFQLTGGEDTGLNELDVLNYWRKHTEGGDKILAYAAVDHKSHARVQQAIHLFGGVYLGFQVQANCIQEFDAHQPWTPGKLTQDGHAVYAVGYDAEGVTVLTWGARPPRRALGRGGTSAWTRRMRSCRRRRRPPGSRRGSTTPNSKPI